LAHQLAMKARENSLDKTKDSPFAILAKENDIMWSGGMCEIVLVFCALVLLAAEKILTIRPF